MNQRTLPALVSILLTTNV